MIAFHQTRPATRCLYDAAPGDLVEVGLIAFDFVRTACWHLAIRPGEILQCVERRPEGVLAARSDGSRVRVPHECARFIGVRHLEGHLDIHDVRIADGRSDPSDRRSVH